MENMQTMQQIQQMHKMQNMYNTCTKHHNKCKKQIEMKKNQTNNK